jgi:hypothetical protein
MTLRTSSLLSSIEILLCQVSNILASINAFDGEQLEDDLVPVDERKLRRQAK